MSSDTITSTPLRSAPRPRVRHVLHALYPQARSFVLPNGATVIGREGDFAFPADRAMSRAHAEVTLSDGRAHARDLGSHNGTWHEGARVDHARLSDGDLLRLGDTFLLYRVEPVELLDAPVPGIAGHAPALRALRAALAQAAPTRASVVLLGETGTGKSLAARALHAASGRTGDFIHVNCAAIPETTAESTLFGHVAGAFTDARTDAPGLFRAAHRGTLFLDEVALLSAASQARLLLALETGRVTPVGGTRPVPVDVRVVAATNEDLPTALESRRFRPDLYARLAELSLVLPPLRERREDILPLLTSALGPGAPALSPDAAHLLLHWHWPYDVRELEKLAGELRIRAAGLPILDASVLGDRYAEPPRRAAAPPAPEPDGPPDADTLAALLADANGNVSELARRVGRSTKQVYRWCARHGLDPARFRRE